MKEEKVSKARRLAPEKIALRLGTERQIDMLFSGSKTFPDLCLLADKATENTYTPQFNSIVCRCAMAHPNSPLLRLACPYTKRSLKSTK